MGKSNFVKDWTRVIKKTKIDRRNGKRVEPSRIGVYSETRKNHLKTLLARERDKWSTPTAIVELARFMASRLNPDLYWKGFDLDPCAEAWSAKAPRFFTIKDDGLTQSWQGSKLVFVNPPYSNPKAWLQKMAREHSIARKNGQRMITVFLLPSDTGTKWFTKYFTNLSMLTFLTPRIKFVPTRLLLMEFKAIEKRTGKKRGISNPRASLLMVFDSDRMYVPPHGKTVTVVNWQEWWAKRMCVGKKDKGYKDLFSYLVGGKKKRKGKTNGAKV